MKFIFAGLAFLVLGSAKSQTFSSLSKNAMEGASAGKLLNQNAGADLPLHAASQEGHSDSSASYLPPASTKEDPSASVKTEPDVNTLPIWMGIGSVSVISVLGFAGRKRIRSESSIRATR